MAFRSLEVTIISAKGLNKVNLVGKMDVYAVVYINNTTANQQQHQKQKTQVDKDGDSNPTWNHSMFFKIDESAALQNRLTLVVKIKTEGMFGDKDLGEVHVPVKELLEGVNSNGKPLQFVSYQVRKPSGKPKGELSFSYKFGELPVVGKIEDQPPVAAYPAGFTNNSIPAGITNNGIPARKVDQPDKKADEPVTAYPAGGPGVGVGLSGPVPGSLYPPVYAAGGSGVGRPNPPTPGSLYPPVYAGGAAVASPYSPTGGVYVPPPAGYPQPPPHSGYGYQQQQQPGYPPYPPAGYPPPGYGGYPPQQPGYGYPGGYPPVQQPQQTQKKSKFGGMGLGAGLLGGALGGLLIGDMVSDASGGCGGGCGGGGCGGGF